MYQKLDSLYWEGNIVLADFDNLTDFFEHCQHAKFIALQWNYHCQISWPSLAALFAAFQRVPFSRLQMLCIPMPTITTENNSDWLSVLDELPGLRELHLDIWLNHTFDYRNFVTRMRRMPNITVFLSGKFTDYNLYIFI